MTVVLLSAAVLIAGCGAKKDKASQTAAKVNKEEITVHQINFVLQQQRGIRPEQADAAGKQVLERLIDQELALQKASELKVDRDPRVVQQIEAARRDVLARAYTDKLGEAVQKPSSEEVRKYYEEKPALFKERRIYSIQEVTIEATPEQLPALRTKLAQSKAINDFVEYLKASDFKFSANQAVRAAEQLPLASLDKLAQLKDGQSVFNPTPTGAQVVLIAGSRSQPVDLERAAPAIEQFLLNERKREVVAKELKTLRDAAKIEYVGKFADAASAPGSKPAATPGVSPAASGGLDSNTINKGLAGIK